MGLYTLMTILTNLCLFVDLHNSLPSFAAPLFFSFLHGWIYVLYSWNICLVYVLKHMSICILKKPFVTCYRFLS